MRKVALDVHKRISYVVIREGKQEVMRRKFGTDQAGEKELLGAIRPGDRVVMEATTGVMRLATRLEGVGATVYVLDPQRTRAVGMRGQKTDYRDCLALLEYLELEQLPVVWRPDPATRELRQLTRERRAFNQNITRMKNRVRSVLRDEGLDHPRGPWTPEGREWLDEQSLPPTTRRMLLRELAAIAVEESLKAEQDREFAQLALASEAAQRLMQHVGYGAAAAMMWLGEVGDLARFPSGKQLTSYAGMNPRVHQSGERCRLGNISKAGRSQLRWIMVEVAWNHVANDGPEADHYHRLLARGKPKGVAIVALARRLLVLAYDLLRRKEPHRELTVAPYEAKLARLAACRPRCAEPEPCDLDWAADQVEILTGHVSGRRMAGKPRRNRPQARQSRTPHRPGAVETRRDLSGRKHGRGSASEVPADQELPPQRGEGST
jgi:transposase